MDIENIKSDGTVVKKDKHVAIVLSIFLVVGISILSSELFGACSSTCDGEADCTSDCLQTRFGLGYICGEVKPLINPGSVCADSENPDETCDNDTSVPCGQPATKTCSGPPSPPDCTGAQNTPGILNMAGCAGP